MLKILEAVDGTVYASTKGRSQVLTVDEVIEFLEDYRGMEFYNGAAEDTSFRVQHGMVACDRLDFWTSELEDSEYAERIEDWFDTDEQYLNDCGYSPAEGEYEED